MELNPEAMEALKQAMAKQITEATRAMSTQFQQQMEQLDNKFEQKFKGRASASSASEHSSSEPLSPNAAIRLVKGKAQVGTSKSAQQRRVKSPTGEREDRFILRGNTRTTRDQRRTENITGRRLIIESSPDHSEEEAASDHSQETVRRNRNRHHGRNYDPLRQQLKHLKIQYPSFHGTNDPEAYLDWERKMESNFQVQGTYEANKVKIAISEFNGYALLWWEQLGITRQRQREAAIVTWDQLVTQMRKKFVPAHYQREILTKLRRLIQGTKSVRDYYQELETLMIRADLSESEDMVMSRFLGGLNREIQDKVELQNYEDVQEMVHKAELIESQIKRKGVRSAFSSSIPKPKEFSKSVFTKETKPATSAV